MLIGRNDQLAQFIDHRELFSSEKLLGVGARLSRLSFSLKRRRNDHCTSSQLDDFAASRYLRRQDLRFRLFFFIPHSTFRIPHLFSFFIPHSAFRIPHLFSFFIPHSAFRIPHSHRFPFLNSSARKSHERQASAIIVHVGF